MKNMKSLSASCALLALYACSTTAASSSSAGKEPWQLAEETEVWSPVPPVVDTSKEIPSDAIALFSGKSLELWESAKGGAAPWTLQDGTLTVVPQSGDIRTKASFCDVQLHVEWKMPTKVTDDNGKLLESQARNNSGIFLQEKYEVQVLDSYQNKTYSNGQAGSIYKQSIPLVNASRAPGQWQSYDIIFSAPQFDATQKLTKPGYVTVLHNGVLVQNHFEIQGATEWIGKPQYKAHGCAPIRLQDHGNPVSYRNIWVRKL